MQRNILLEEIENIINGQDDDIIIACDERRYTYKDFRQRYQAWQEELREYGIKAGATVILCIDDEMDFIPIWLALWKLDCIPIPLETKVSVKEAEQAIESGHAAAMITNKDFLMVNGIRRHQKSKLVPEISCLFTRFDRNDGGTGGISLYFYTSGTTGAPKCVMFSHDAMYRNIADLAAGLKLTGDDVFFTPLSPQLPATLTTAVLPILLRGGRLVLTQKQLPRSIARKVKDSQATIFFGVPYLYELLKDSVGLDLDAYFESVRICLSSSAYLDRPLIRQFYELSKRYIRSIYCSSEAGLISYNDSADPEIIINTVGRACKDTKVKLIYENGADIGEIWVSGSHLSHGYYQQEQLQKGVYLDDMVRTGDLGTIDLDGNITLLGRIQDTINIGGYLVVPSEVEEVLTEIDGIKEAVVFGKNDDGIRQTVAARVVLKGQEVTADQVISHCAGRLSHYKVPRIIEFADELPKSRYGKKVRIFQAEGGQP